MYWNQTIKTRPFKPRNRDSHAVAFCFNGYLVENMEKKVASLVRRGWAISRASVLSSVASLLDLHWNWDEQM